MSQSLISAQRRTLLMDLEKSLAEEILSQNFTVTCLMLYVFIKFGNVDLFGGSLIEVKVSWSADADCVQFLSFIYILEEKPYETKGHFQFLTHVVMAILG
jgi:hypothetical protein